MGNLIDGCCKSKRVDAAGTYADADVSSRFETELNARTAEKLPDEDGPHDVYDMTTIIGKRNLAIFKRYLS